MEVSGLQQMQNEAVMQSKDISLMKQGMDLEEKLVTDLIDSLPKGGVNHSAPAGQQVNIQA